MLDIEENTYSIKTKFYKTIIAQMQSLLEGERDAIANMANFAALLFHSMEFVNWVGFYIYKENELVLGPFQGKPACIRIGVGKGVCGTAADTLKTQSVDNVHEFPGHIPCDSASNSEIVIPIVINSKLIGVLDIDSPEFSRFNEVDQTGLEKLVDVLKSGTDFSSLN
jgi:L-methionine (R)-S-oxide reductase